MATCPMNYPDSSSTGKLELENNSYASDVREFGLAVARRDLPMSAIEA